MDPLLFLGQDRLSVDPGGETRVRLTVRNPGELVEQYRFEVLGELARGWVEVVPQEVSVMPEGTREEVAEVIIRPPAAPAAPAGEVPFGIRCVSREHPRNCAVVEGDILVSTVVDLQVRLLPFGSDGHRRGRFRLEVRNTGTTPVTVAVAAIDGADLLRFAIAPVRLSVGPRDTSSVFIAVRARTSKLVGRPIDHAATVMFEVLGVGRRGEQQLTYSQHPVVPRWVLVLLAMLAGALLIAVALLWPFGRAPDLELRASAPPRMTVTSVTPGEFGTATVAWTRSAYADSYIVQLMQGPAGGEPRTVPAPQVRYTWKDLPSGEQCFSVVPENDNGRGPDSEPVCTLVAAAPVPSTPVPSVTAPATDTPLPTTTSPPPPTPEDRRFEPEGWYVVYYRAALDDKVMEDRVREVAAALQGAGAKPRVVSSLQSEALADGTDGFWYVLSDGFADQEAAEADCSAYEDVPDVICRPEPPP